MRRTAISAWWTVAALACSEPAAVGGDATGAKVDAADASSGACATGAACDDGNPCTKGDTCKAGQCAGVPVNCDDGLDCTKDACANGDCTHVPGAGVCTIGSACVPDGAKNAKNPCQKCVAATTAVGWTVDVSATCDDGSACTVGDKCAVDAACAGTPTVCDDKNPCTADGCDPAKGCTSKPATGPCQDANLCLTGDTCAGGQCTSGTTPLQCDDANPCTTDSCNPKTGCVHKLNAQGCNDGEPCTAPDVCTGGQCIGVKTGACAPCSKVMAAIASKLTLFQIGNSGHKGDGLDVDGNPNTCAPSSNCSQGIDNAVSVLAPFINKPLVASVLDGTLSFVAEFDGYTGPDKPFTLNLYYAVLTPQDKSAGCKPLADVCSWNVTQAAFAGSCKPKFSFPDATLKDGKLVAGGKGTVFAMDADVIGAKNATLYVKGARIEGEVKLAQDGKSLVAVQGILVGAVPKTAVTDMIGALDDDAFAQFGLKKKDVLELIDNLLELDVDVDNDGEKEAASIGIRFSGIGAKLAGVQK
jgi:hypothetical protein